MATGTNDDTIKRRKPKSFAKITPGSLQSRLIELRLKHGFSQKQLAEKSGLHENTIYAIENKGVTPQIPTLMKICRALNIPLDEVLKAAENAE